MTDIELLISGLVIGGWGLAYYLGTRRTKDETPFSLACKLNKHLTDLLEKARIENARLTTIISTMKMAAQAQDFNSPVRGMADLLRKQYPMVAPEIPENDEVVSDAESFTFDGGLA